MAEQKVKIEIDDKELDTLTAKANQLIELLREVQQTIDSLSGREKLES